MGLRSLNWWRSFIGGQSKADHGLYGQEVRGIRTLSRHAASDTARQQSGKAN
jgi:hypothetical protein